MHKQRDPPHSWNAHTQDQTIRKAERHVPGWGDSLLAHRIGAHTHACPYTHTDTLTDSTEDTNSQNPGLKPCKPQSDPCSAHPGT